MLAGPCHGIPYRGDPDGELCLTELSPDILSPAAAAVGGALSVELGHSSGSAVCPWPFAAGVTPPSLFPIPLLSALILPSWLLKVKGSEATESWRAQQSGQEICAGQKAQGLFTAPAAFGLGCLGPCSCPVWCLGPASQAPCRCMIDATCVFQFLQCLQTEEMTETILQLMSTHLLSDCKEMRRLVLRGLLVLCRSPWNVRRAG